MEEYPNGYGVVFDMLNNETFVTAIFKVKTIKVNIEAKSSYEYPLSPNQIIGALIKDKDNNIVTTVDYFTEYKLYADSNTSHTFVSWSVGEGDSAVFSLVNATNSMVSGIFSEKDEITIYANFNPVFVDVIVTNDTNGKYKLATDQEFTQEQEKVYPIAVGTDLNLQVSSVDGYQVTQIKIDGIEYEINKDEYIHTVMVENIGLSHNVVITISNITATIVDTTQNIEGLDDGVYGFESASTLRDEMITLGQDILIKVNPKPNYEVSAVEILSKGTILSANWTVDGGYLTIPASANITFNFNVTITFRLKLLTVSIQTLPTDLEVFGYTISSQVGYNGQNTMNINQNNKDEVFKVFATDKVFVKVTDTQVGYSFTGFEGYENQKTEIEFSILESVVINAVYLKDIIVTIKVLEVEGVGSVGAIESNAQGQAGGYVQELKLVIPKGNNQDVSFGVSDPSYQFAGLYYDTERIRPYQEFVGDKELTGITLNIDCLNAITEDTVLYAIFDKGYYVNLSKKSFVQGVYTQDEGGQVGFSNLDFSINRLFVANQVTINIVGVADIGYSFYTYQINGSDVLGQNTSVNNEGHGLLTTRVSDREVNIECIFAPSQILVEVVSDPQGLTYDFDYSVTGTERYTSDGQTTGWRFAYNTLVTITAPMVSGYKFMGWEGVDIETMTIIGASITFNVTEETHLIARYQASPILKVSVLTDEEVREVTLNDDGLTKYSAGKVAVFEKESEEEIDIPTLFDSFNDSSSSYIYNILKGDNITFIVICEMVSTKYDFVKVVGGEEELLFQKIIRNGRTFFVVEYMYDISNNYQTIDFVFGTPINVTLKVNDESYGSAEFERTSKKFYYGDIVNIVTSPNEHFSLFVENIDVYPLQKAKVEINENIVSVGKLYEDTIITVNFASARYQVTLSTTENEAGEIGSINVQNALQRIDNKNYIFEHSAIAIFTTLPKETGKYKFVCYEIEGSYELLEGYTLADYEIKMHVSSDLTIKAIYATTVNLSGEVWVNDRYSASTQISELVLQTYHGDLLVQELKGTIIDTTRSFEGNTLMIKVKEYQGYKFMGFLINGSGSLIVPELVDGEYVHTIDELTENINVIAKFAYIYKITLDLYVDNQKTQIDVHTPTFESNGEYKNGIIYSYHGQALIVYTSWNAKSYEFVGYELYYTDTKAVYNTNVNVTTNTITLANVDSDITIKCSFTAQYVDITLVTNVGYTAGDWLVEGTKYLSRDNIVSVKFGSQVTLSMRDKENYKVYTIAKTEDEFNSPQSITEIALSQTILINNPDREYVIYGLVEVLVTVDKSTLGSVEFDENFRDITQNEAQIKGYVLGNTEFNLNINANPGYEVKEILKRVIGQTLSSVVELPDKVTMPTNYTVEYDLSKCEVTLQIEGEGKVNINGNSYKSGDKVAFNYNENITFDIIAEKYYYLTNILVDEQEQDFVENNDLTPTYTFVYGEIKDDITAKFVLMERLSIIKFYTTQDPTIESGDNTIKGTVSYGGTQITGDGEVQVPYGSNTFKLDGLVSLEQTTFPYYIKYRKWTNDAWTSWTLLGVSKNENGVFAQSTQINMIIESERYEVIPVFTDIANISDNFSLLLNVTGVDTSSYNFNVIKNNSEQVTTLPDLQDLIYEMGDSLTLNFTLTNENYFISMVKITSGAISGSGTFVDIEEVTEMYTINGEGNQREIVMNGLATSLRVDIIIEQKYKVTISLEDQTLMQYTYDLGGSRFKLDTQNNQLVALYSRDEVLGILPIFTLNGAEYKGLTDTSSSDVMYNENSIILSSVALKPVFEWNQIFVEVYAMMTKDGQTVSQNKGTLYPQQSGYYTFNNLIEVVITDSQVDDTYKFYGWARLVNNQLTLLETQTLDGDNKIYQSSYIVTREDCINLESFAIVAVFKPIDYKITVVTELADSTGNIVYSSISSENSVNIQTYGISAGFGSSYTQSQTLNVETMAEYSLNAVFGQNAEFVAWNGLGMVGFGGSNLPNSTITSIIVPNSSLTANQDGDYELFIYAQFKIRYVTITVQVNTEALAYGISLDNQNYIESGDLFVEYGKSSPLYMKVEKTYYLSRLVINENEVQDLTTVRLSGQTVGNNIVYSYMFGKITDNQVVIIEFSKNYKVEIKEKTNTTAQGNDTESHTQNATYSLLNVENGKQDLIIQTFVSKGYTLLEYKIFDYDDRTKDLSEDYNIEMPIEECFDGTNLTIFNIDKNVYVEITYIKKLLPIKIYTNLGTNVDLTIKSSYASGDDLGYTREGDICYIYYGDIITITANPTSEDGKTFTGFRVDGGELLAEIKDMYIFDEHEIVAYYQFMVNVKVVSVFNGKVVTIEDGYSTIIKYNNTEYLLSDFADSGKSLMTGYELYIEMIPGSQVNAKGIYADSSLTERIDDGSGVLSKMLEEGMTIYVAYAQRVKLSFEYDDTKGIVNVNGNLVENNEYYVSYNDNVTITPVGNTGYGVQSILVDDMAFDIAGVNEIRNLNVTKEMLIKVTFGDLWIPIQVITNTGDYQDFVFSTENRGEPIYDTENTEVIVGYYYQSSAIVKIEVKNAVEGYLFSQWTGLPPLINGDDQSTAIEFALTNLESRVITANYILCKSVSVSITTNGEERNYDGGYIGTTDIETLKVENINLTSAVNLYQDNQIAYLEYIANPGYGFIDWFVIDEVTQSLVPLSKVEGITGYEEGVVKIGQTNVNYVKFNVTNNYNIRAMFGTKYNVELKTDIVEGTIDFVNGYSNTVLHGQNVEATLKAQTGYEFNKYIVSTINEKVIGELYIDSEGNIVKDIFEPSYNMEFMLDVENNKLTLTNITCDLVVSIDFIGLESTVTSNVYTINESGQGSDTNEGSTGSFTYIKNDIELTDSNIQKYRYNDTVVIIAPEPTANYNFTGWEFVSEELSNYVVDGNKITFTMPLKDVSLKAVYTYSAKVTVKVMIDGKYMDETFTKGAIVAFESKANPDRVFEISSIITGKSSYKIYYKLFDGDKVEYRDFLVKVEGLYYINAEGQLSANTYDKDYSGVKISTGRDTNGFLNYEIPYRNEAITFVLVLKGQYLITTKVEFEDTPTPVDTFGSMNITTGSNVCDYNGGVGVNIISYKATLLDRIELRDSQGNVISECTEFVTSEENNFGWQETKFSVSNVQSDLTIVAIFKYKKVRVTVATNMDTYEDVEGFGFNNWYMSPSEIENMIENGYTYKFNNTISVKAPTKQGYKLLGIYKVYENNEELLTTNANYEFVITTKQDFTLLAKYGALVTVTYEEGSESLATASITIDGMIDGQVNTTSNELITSAYIMPEQTFTLKASCVNGYKVGVWTKIDSTGSEEVSDFDEYSVSSFTIKESTEYRLRVTPISFRANAVIEGNGSAKWNEEDTPSTILQEKQIAYLDTLNLYVISDIGYGISKLVINDYVVFENGKYKQEDLESALVDLETNFGIKAQFNDFGSYYLVQILEVSTDILIKVELDVLTYEITLHQNDYGRIEFVSNPNEQKITVKHGEFIDLLLSPIENYSVYVLEIRNDSENYLKSFYDLSSIYRLAPEYIVTDLDIYAIFVQTEQLYYLSLEITNIGMEEDNNITINDQFVEITYSEFGSFVRSEDRTNQTVSMFENIPILAGEKTIIKFMASNTCYIDSLFIGNGMEGSQLEFIYQGQILEFMEDDLRNTICKIEKVYDDTLGLYVVIVTFNNYNSDTTIYVTYSERPSIILQVPSDEGYLTEITSMLNTQFVQIEDLEEDGKVINQYIAYYDYNQVITLNDLPRFTRMGFVFNGYDLGGELITEIQMTQSITLLAAFTSKKVTFEYNYKLFEGDSELTGYDTNTYGKVSIKVFGETVEYNKFSVGDNLTIEFANKPGFSWDSWRILKNGELYKVVDTKEINDFIITHEDAEIECVYTIICNLSVETYTLKLVTVSDLPSEDIIAEFVGEESAKVVYGVSPIKKDAYGNDYSYRVEISYPISHEFDINKITVSTYETGVDVNGGFDYEVFEEGNKVILFVSHIGALDSSQLEVDKATGNKLIYLICRVDCKKYYPTIEYIDEDGTTIENQEQINGEVTFEGYNNFIEESGQVIYYYNSAFRMIITTKSGYILRYDNVQGQKRYYILDENLNKVYVEDITGNDSLSRKYVLYVDKVQTLQSMNFKIYFTVTNLKVELYSYPSNQAELTGGGDIEYGQTTTIKAQETVYDGDMEIYRFVRWERVNEAGVVIEDPILSSSFTIDRVENNMYYRAVYSFRVEVVVTNEKQNAGNIGVVPQGTKIDITTELFDHIYIEPKQSITLVIESGTGYKISSVDNLNVEKQYVVYEDTDTIRDLIETITFDDDDSTYCKIGVTFVSKPVTVKVASNDNEGTLDETIPTEEDVFYIGDVIELKVLPNFEGGFKFSHWNSTTYGQGLVEGEDYEKSGQVFYTISEADAEYGKIYFSAQYEKITYTLKIIQNYYDDGKIFVSNLFGEIKVGHGVDYRLEVTKYNANELVEVLCKNLTTGETNVLVPLEEGGYSFDMLYVNTSYELTITYKPINWIDHYQMPNGNGTKDSPYLITTAEELAFVSYAVNNSVPAESGKTAYAYAYYLLESDIDLTGKFWSPIGINEDNKIFQGVFNYNFHSVSNINYDRSWLTVMNSGLFGAVGKNASIYASNLSANNTLLIIAIISVAVIIACVIGYILYRNYRRKKLLAQGEFNAKIDSGDDGIENLKLKMQERAYLKKEKKRKEKLEKKKAKNDKLRAKYAGGGRTLNQEEPTQVENKPRNLSRGSLSDRNSQNKDQQ
ncbi:MAG: hypothetical protein IJW82_02530 [Clostridia bacterium]|nr:hypothetical protein [Clostridia bacterium]